MLLIGCVNIAGLLMARGVARAPEIATRIALGGGRAAIVRQLLTESVVLAALGGAAGVLLGYAGSRAFATLLEDAFGVAPAGIGLDARVLAITVARARSAPASCSVSCRRCRRAGVNLRAALVDSGSGSIAGAARSWPRRVLVVAEVALGVVLLVGAGLLIRSFERLMTLRAGFDRHARDDGDALAAGRALSDAGEGEPVLRRVARAHAADPRRRERGRIADAAVRARAQPRRALGRREARRRGDPDHEPDLRHAGVFPDAAHSGHPRPCVHRGRAASAAPVIVVNQAFVARSSPDQDPIGRQIAGGGVARTIVGIVGDIQQKAGWGNFGPVAPVPASYIPAAQTNAAYLRMVHTWFSPSWFVRLRAPQPGIAAEMQRAVETVDPLLPFAKFRTLDDVRGEAVATQRAQTVLLGALAALALLLAAVGLYGLVANTVAERRASSASGSRSAHIASGDRGCRDTRFDPRGRRRCDRRARRAPRRRRRCVTWCGGFRSTIR